jgi:hypothetical protein
VPGITSIIGRPAYPSVSSGPHESPGAADTRHPCSRLKQFARSNAVGVSSIFWPMRQRMSPIELILRVAAKRTGHRPARQGAASVGAGDNSAPGGAPVTERNQHKERRHRHATDSHPEPTAPATFLSVVRFLLHADTFLAGCVWRGGAPAKPIIQWAIAPDAGNNKIHSQRDQREIRSYVCSSVSPAHKSHQQQR